MAVCVLIAAGLSVTGCERSENNETSFSPAIARPEPAAVPGEPVPDFSEQMYDEAFVPDMRTVRAEPSQTVQAVSFVQESAASPASARQKKNLPPLDSWKTDYYRMPSGDSVMPVPAQPSAVSSDGTFTVVDSGPQGILPSQVKNPSVYVLFSEPVVPLAALGEPSGKSDAVTITPPLEGVFRWYGTNMLSFECSQEIIPQQFYTVKVNPGLKSVSGKSLDGEYVFSFQTETLSLVSVIPGYVQRKDGIWISNDNVPPEAARSIGIHFSWPVNPDVIKEYLFVSDGSKNYAYTITETDGTFIALKVNELLPENRLITVSLAPGARSEKNYLGTTSAQKKTFRTLRPFAVSSARTDTGSYGKYSNPVRLYFSQPVNPGSVAGNIRTEPPMAITAENVETSGSVVIVYGLPVTFGQKYTLFVNDGVTDTYGRRLVKSYTCNVTVPDAASYVSFRDYGFKMIESQFPPKLVFEYQNIFPPSSYTVSSYTGDAEIKEELDASGGPRNTRIFRVVDLQPFVNGAGAGMIRFNASVMTEARYGNEKELYENRNDLDVQVTDLGVTVRYGINKAVVLVTSLKTGKPVSGASVDIYGFRADDDVLRLVNSESSVPPVSGITDRRGMAVIPFEYGSYSRITAGRKNLYICVSKDGDRAVFNPAINYPYRFGVNNFTSPDSVAKTSMQTFMFTDRGVYRPGERVSMRGIDRNLLLGTYSPYAGPYTIDVKKDTWNAQTVFSLEGTTTGSGGFHQQFSVPETLEPGDYRMEYRRAGSKETASAVFTVAYFERLRFESSVAIAPVTYVRGDTVRASITAGYLGGGTLADASFEANWFRAPSWFRPADKAYDGFSFGPRHAYDGRSFIASESGYLTGNGMAQTEQKTGNEDVAGLPYSYRVESRVTDAGNQMIGASASVTVHPARYYIGVSGVKNRKGFPKKGETLAFDYVLVTPDGKVPADTLYPKNGDDRFITAELKREEWKLVQQQGVAGSVNSRYTREMVSEQTEKIKLSGKGSFTVKPPKSGAYVLSLSASDSDGNTVLTEYSFYVTGSDWSYWGNSAAQSINLIPEKSMYMPGETANILMQSPLPAGRYLITVEREGIFTEEIREFNDAVSVIEIPIAANYVPVVYVSVSSYSVRSGAPSHEYGTPDMDKPKGYYGLAAVHVDPRVNAFSVAIKADKTAYKPGDTVTLSLSATKNGKPVPHAELTVMAVDRGVLDLIDYHVPDPVAFFYSEEKFPLAVYGGDSRSLLIDPVTYEVRNLFGGDASADKMNERKNFDATAVFEPYVLADGKGKAVCTFTLPDSLTAYRITVIGVSDNMFALNEDEIAVRNEISVRDVLPRKLRVRDTGETGVIISNLDSKTHNVSVSLDVYAGAEKSGLPLSENGLAKPSGAAEVDGETSVSVSVKPGETVPVMFYVAAQAPGYVSLEYTVRSDILNERIIKPLEIERPYVYETVTTTGRIDGESAVEYITLPLFADNGKGSLFVQLDPTRLGILKEAVQYVFRYPYGCLEQRSSAVLPLILFGEYIDVFGLESDVTDYADVIETEIENWLKYQRPDGGFPYWQNGIDSSYAVTLRLAEILSVAKHKNVGFPSAAESALRSAADYIRKERAKRKYGYYADAYSLYVQQLAGFDVPVSELRKVEDSPGSDICEWAYAGLTYFLKEDRSAADRIVKKIRTYMRPSAQGADISAVRDG